jgi:hypothetical protein
MSPFTRRGATHSVAGLSGTAGNDETTLDLVEELLMQLTMSVPYIRDEDIPTCMRRHTSGGGSRFTQLFHKVARAIACYSEHHHDEYSSCGRPF